MEPKTLRRCDIKRIVEERLSGFHVRQLERNATRARKRKSRLLAEGIYLDVESENRLRQLALPYESEENK
jgi:hypothetical protein